MITRNFTFRSKLIGLTALPLLLIGYLSLQDVQDARSTRQAASHQLAELDHERAIATLAAAVGAERGALFDPSGTDAALAAARADVDTAMAALRSPELGFKAVPLSEAEQVYAQLVVLRTRIGAAVAPVQAAIANRQDSDVLDAVVDLSALPERILDVPRYEVSDRQTQANLTTTVLLQRAEEALALEGTALQQALAEGAPSHDSLERVGALIGASNEAIDVVRDLGVPSATDDLTGYLNGPAWAEYQALRTRFTRLLIGQHVRIDPAYVVAQRTSVAAEFEAREQNLRQQMNHDTMAVDSRAARDLLVAVTISIGVLALVAGFLYLLARSMRRSLGRLEHRATRIAAVELPEIVQTMRTQGDRAQLPEIDRLPVTTNDEIGRLSAAFNQLQDTAVQLAGEQAASRAVVAHMFVNLGRRNQKLLMRMLQSLDELERDESDPDRLARLYEVDHLATRMRRNAESLLVLADAGVVRRFEGSVAISDLLRSVMAEVAEFERIELTVMDDAEISGDAAADLAHLLSELTENAAKFSPPGEPIEIIARYTRMGYMVAVLDSGMGLTAAEIAEANARIAAAAGSDETPSKHLGHFVVGKLAGKYGMEVEVFDRIPAGLTVRVRIPRSMIVSRPPAGVIEMAATPPPVPGRAATAGDPRPPGPTAVRPPTLLPPDDFEPPTAPVPASRPGTGVAVEVASTTLAEIVDGETVDDHDDHEAEVWPSPPLLPTRRVPALGAPVAAGPAAGNGTATGNGMVGDHVVAAGNRGGVTGNGGTAAGNGDVEQVFGARRRVAGANLPVSITPAPAPEPDLEALRGSAEAVGAALGALQRGLRGGNPGPTRPEPGDS